LIPKITAVDSSIFYGLDTENNRDSTRDITRVVIIAFPEEIDSRVAVLHLSKMGVFEEDQFPQSLKQVLELKSMVPVAVNIGYDTSRLETLGVKFGSDPREIMDVAKTLQPSHPSGYGLQKLADCVLGLYVDKFGQNADYSWILSNELAHYCALDAHLHLLLYTTI
jgi:hypothetical protein